MKKFIVLGFILMVSVVAFAQAPSASPMPSPAMAAASASGFMGMIGFIKDHLGAFSLLIYAILDVAILLNPKLDANGLVHQIFLLAGKESGQQPPQQ